MSDTDTQLVSRRDVIRGTAATIATVSVAGLASADHEDTKDRDVDLVYDQSYLHQYRPMLDLSGVDVTNRPTLRGWVASTPDEDTTVCIYACEYAFQDGGWLDLTTHSGDHEWFYTVVDDSTGDIKETIYTAYHWLRGRQTTPTIYEDNDGPHPVYRVDGTYHHYYPAPDESDAELLDVEALADYDNESGAFYRWLKNGMESDLRRGAVHDPWLMVGSNGYADWWSREGITWKNRVIAGSYSAGLAGASTADRGIDE